MKIVITLNELKAGNKLIGRLGIASDMLTGIFSDMKDGETLTHEEMMKKLGLEFDDNKFLADLNKNKKVMSVTKHLDGVGTACFTMIISEEFVCDVNEMYGDLIIETAHNLKVVLKVLSGFYKSRVKNFLDKWQIQG